MKKIKLSKEQTLGIIRHTLTFVGGLLVLKGIVDEAAINEIVGGTITVVGTIWSIVSKQA
jgi:hypothetical protein